MNKKTRFPNVEPRAKSIRIKFHFRGNPCRETLPLEPTLRNQRVAHQRLTQINQQIVLGIFDYAAEFPNSPNVTRLGLQPKNAARGYTFGELADKFLKINNHLSAGTLDGYRKCLSRFWRPLWEETKITDIPYSEIAEEVAEIDWPSAKRRNNCLTPLRGVFELAWMDEILPNNPVARIKNQKIQKPVPDPFGMDEIEKILEHMREKYDPQVTNYFEFAFFSGLRIEEQIALQWGDVDWNRRYVRIQRAQTAGELKTVKNNKIRDVDLNTRAFAALKRQKEYTFLAGHYVFLNPVTGNPWNDNGKAQRIRYWNPTLKKQGIRHRRPYNTRHSYATLQLMAGNKPAYAAKQMGHSLIVFLTVYARWIDTEEQEGEKGKLENFLIPKKSPEETKKK